MKRLYSAYGLSIQSKDLYLSSLPNTQENPQIFIEYGNVPNSLQNSRLNGIRYWLKEKEYLLKVDGVAKYYVCNGEKIIIEPFPGSIEEDILVFLYSSVFGALLIQRGCLVLHGSACEINGRACIFLGRTGLGKTAFTAAMYQKGYSVICDEICAVRIIEGIPQVLPGIPRLSLWGDTINKLGMDVKELDSIRPSIQKYKLDVSDRFSSKPVRPEIVVILESNNEIEFRHKTVLGGEKIENIINQTYRFDYLEAVNKKSENFMQCITLSKSIEGLIVEHYGNKWIGSELIGIVEKKAGIL